MSRRLWIVALALVLVGVIVAATATASSGSARLTGAWSGSIVRGPGDKGAAQRMVIVVNKSERGGSWKVDAKCEGQLRLKDISNGFHHYIEELAPGATCLGGGIDCLKRTGAGMLDEFQPQPATDPAFSTTTFRRSASA